MFSKQIHNLVVCALTSLQITPDKLSIDIPTDMTNGDYMTNIALSLAKDLKIDPMILAQKIVDLIPPNEILASAKAIKPGFINFVLNSNKLAEILTTFNFEHDKCLQNKSITVEFTDPNPFKEFHVGHLYSNTAGESISRLLEWAGAKVRRVCYQGDVGIHVACSIWGMINQNTKSSNSPNYEQIFSQIESLTLVDRVKWMGQCYAYGATQYKDNPQAQSEIKVLNAQIFMAAQSMWKKARPDFVPKVDYQSLITKEVYPQQLVEQLYEKGRQWTLDYFETIYHKLGTKFDGYYFESFVGELGYDFVFQHINDGIFERSEGAIVFKGEKYGYHTRVFINSIGLPTYEAKELGLNPTKYQDSPFDTSLIITANEIDEYFKVVLKALSLINADVGSKTKHISHGMVKLPEGKMSSRTGKIISGESLLDEACSRLQEIVTKSQKLPPEKISDTVEKLSVAAIKYAFLKSNLGKDVIFSFDESLSFEGNSGPYILYTRVRCNSILDKAGSLGEFSLPDDINELDLNILRQLIHFPDIVGQAARQYAPHLICTYIHKLAQAFNAYYDKAPILTADATTRAFRLHIVSRIAQVIKQGVNLMGFETVDRM